MLLCYSVIILPKSETLDRGRMAAVNCYSDATVTINSVVDTAFCYNDVAVFMLHCSARSHSLVFDPTSGTQCRITQRIRLSHRARLECLIPLFRHGVEWWSS